MALEEKMIQVAAPAQNVLTDDEEQDLKIAVMLTQNLIDDGGIELIDKALEESKDPGQVIGQFMMQIVSQASEQLPEDVQLSDRIYFAKDGWIEQVSDYLQEQYDVPKKVMDRAEMYIGTAAQKMAQGAQQQGGAPSPEQAGAPQGPALPMPAQQPAPMGGF